MSAIGPFVSRAKDSTFATRLAGLRKTGRCRLVRCVQVVCELPQVTHSYEQPFTVKTAAIGLRHQPLKGSAPSRSR